MYTIQNKIYGFIQTLPITRLSSNSFKASIVPSREYILWIWGLRDPLLMSLSISSKCFLPSSGLLLPYSPALTPITESVDCDYNRLYYKFN